MYIKRDTRISRRTLLKGAGVTLALPWLEAMAPLARAAEKTEAAAQGAAPVRMAVLWMPNGVRQDKWTPEGTGTDFQLSPLLQPLENYKQDIFVPTNLWNQGSRSGDGHYVKTCGFLTGTTINKTMGVDLNCNGVSMDQVAAQRAGHHTPIPSLELGTEPASTGVDSVVGYTRVYGAHLAWSAPRRPLAKETNPRLVFERLMRSTGGRSVEAKRDASLLDLVLDEARSLRQQLGASDQRRMDEYLDSVRSVEVRLQRAANPEQNPWTPRAEIDPKLRPESEVPPQSHAEHVRLMLDMIALAFQADMTRIATFMFGNAVSNKNFAFLDGVKGAHHSISHHENKEENLAQYEIINRWHTEQFVYLLDKLRNTPEGESNVLDNSMILFGSSLRDGNSHNPHNLPLVLAGKAGGRLRTGQHRSYAKDTPLCNLHLAMLEAFGTPIERFSDSTGKLEGLLES